MTRTEKYRLERSLIELENATEDIVKLSRRQTFINWFDNPMEQLEKLFMREEKR